VAQPTIDLSNLPEVMIPSQVGQVFNKSVDQLAFDRYRGRGPAYVKYGTKIYYLRSDLVAFLEANRHDPAQ
jgi:hypothetical protein